VAKILLRDIPVALVQKLQTRASICNRSLNDEIVQTLLNVLASPTLKRAGADLEYTPDAAISAPYHIPRFTAPRLVHR